MTVRHVLLVDDEPNVTAALARILRGEGYRISCATSASMAMDILATERTDVVISDERMPGQSGSDFISEVRQRYPATLRIMLSGQASMEAALRAINEGEVYRFLAKPCRPEDLKAAIRQGLERQQPLEHDRWAKHERQRQADALRELDVTTRIMRLTTDEDGAILVEDADRIGHGDVDELVSEIERELYRDSG